MSTRPVYPCPQRPQRLTLYFSEQGTYSVRADVYDKNQKQVTCLEADNVEFKI